MGRSSTGQGHRMILSGFSCTCSILLSIIREEKRKTGGQSNNQAQEPGWNLGTKGQCVPGCTHRGMPAFEPIMPHLSQGGFTKVLVWVQTLGN